MIKDPSTNSNLPPKERRAVKIGEASRILGVHIDTLRRWEKSGKITPVRTPGGTRFYSLNELSSLFPKILDNSSQPPSTKQLPVKNLHKIDGKLNQKEKALGGGITAESEAQHLERSDPAKNVENYPPEVPSESSDQIYSGSDLKPLQRIPELLAAAVIFSLLLVIGITNIQISTAKSFQPLPTPVVLSATKEINTSPTDTVKPKIMLTIKVGYEPATVNIRQKPTTNSEKIGTAKNGDTFEFVSLNLGWYEIKLASGSTGFVSAQYIEKEGTNN